MALIRSVVRADSLTLLILSRSRCPSADFRYVHREEEENNYVRTERQFSPTSKGSGPVRRDT